MAVLAAYLWWNRSALFVAAAYRAFGRGQDAAALREFGKAETAGRLDVQNTVGYAYLALKSGLTDLAAELLERTRIHGRRGRSLKEGELQLVETYWSLVLWKQGKVSDAVALLEGLLAKGYRTASLYGNLGYFLLLQGDLNRAETVCREALEWDPEGKVLLDNQAGLHLARHDWPAAAEVYERLLALEPRFPEAWYGAGCAAFRTGDSVEAKRRWERALTLPFHALTTVDRSTVEAALAELENSPTPDHPAFGG